MTTVTITVIRLVRHIEVMGFIVAKQKGGQWFSEHCTLYMTDLTVASLNTLIYDF